MYKLVWKTQSSNAASYEMHETLENAVNEFREALKGLYSHGGGKPLKQHNASIEAGEIL